MPIDYEALRFIWWLLLVVLILGFALTDGFDLGLVALLPWLGKNDEERSLLLKAILPVWESNQVWFILGGGAVFAAWPTVYAVSFSAFYLAMFLLLCTFIIRPVAFKYRDKKAALTWRFGWDHLAQIGAITTCILLGVAVGNVIQGLPFEFDSSLRAWYTGSFWTLLNPFALFCGVLSLAMLITHGSCYVACKLENPIKKRAQKIASLSAISTILLFGIGGYWILYSIPGYLITSAIEHGGPSNPLLKTVHMEVGAWLRHYQDYPYLWVFPSLGISAGFMVVLLQRYSKIAFVFSSLCITGILSTTATNLFPFILPSSTHPEMSLTVWDASSSHLGLWLMLLATIIFLPIVLGYVTWVYRVLKGKVQ